MGRKGRTAQALVSSMFFVTQKQMKTAKLCVTPKPKSVLATQLKRTAMILLFQIPRPRNKLF